MCGPLDGKVVPRPASSVMPHNSISGQPKRFSTSSILATGMVWPPTVQRLKVGELMIRGPIVMHYYGNEKATREAIEPDGWLHTGDLATMDEDGAIFIVDRKKDMINTGGFKVFPAEVPANIRQGLH